MKIQKYSLNLKKTLESIKLYIFLILLIFNMEHVMAKENSEHTTYYFLSVTSKDVIAEIGVNGAPIIKDIDGEGIITAEPVATWLIHGENKLTIKLTPLAANKNNENNPKITIKIFEHDPDFTAPTPKEILAQFEYPPIKTEKNINLPLAENVKFNIIKSIGTKLWNEASEVKEILQNDKQEILMVLKSLEESLVSKNISEAIKLQKYKITDDSIAENKSIEQLESAATKGYKWLNEQSGLTANKITLDSAIFTLCCNNKVVYVTRKNGEEAIQLESDDLYFDIAIYLSKINGEWIIVR